MSYRLAFGNGPTDCATYQEKDLPNTAIRVSDSFCASMQHFHVRVQHPAQDSWTWYTRWRDAKQPWINTPEYAKIHGIAIDELHPNQENLETLKNKMYDVDWWCHSAGVPPPQWLVAINPGNQIAVDYVISGLRDSFPGRVWWFVESYIGLYKGEGEDFGLGNARALLDRMVALGQHDRAVYGINHSHYIPAGQAPSPSYFNVYGTDLTHRDERILSRVQTFLGEVAAKGNPFGYGVWTPGYSSALSRADIDAALTIVGA